MGNTNTIGANDFNDSESSDNPMNLQIDTRRIFSPECIKYPLTKFPSLMKIYQCILPKKFNFTLLNHKYHAFSNKNVELYLHHSYLSITDEKGRGDKHDYAHVHSWGIKNGKGFRKPQLCIKCIDAVDKYQVYILKGNKENIENFTKNIMEIINLIMDGYKINEDLKL